MPEQMPANATFSEDQPVETGAPYNPTDVSAEFDQMVSGKAPEVPQDDPQDDLPEGDENDLDFDPEAEGDELADGEGDEPQQQQAQQAAIPTVEQLQQQIAEMRAQMAAPQQVDEGAADEPTIGQLTTDFAVEAPQEVFAPRQWLGYGGSTPEQEFEAALSTPQGLSAFADRVRQATLRDVFQLFPKMFEGNLKHTLGGAQLDQAFWANNRDLEPHREVVESFAFRMKHAEPGLKASQYLRKLESAVRKHVGKERPATKSGGTQRLPQRGAGGNNQQRRAKPALAGGSGARRTAAPISGFDKEFAQMARATQGR